MPKTATVVEFDLKEIQDALISVAKANAPKENPGTSNIIFLYDEKKGVKGAQVRFGASVTTPEVK